MYVLYVKKPCFTYPCETCMVFLGRTFFVMRFLFSESSFRILFSYLLHMCTNFSYNSQNVICVYHVNSLYPNTLSHKRCKTGFIVDVTVVGATVVVINGYNLFVLKCMHVYYFKLVIANQTTKANTFESNTLRPYILF